MNDMGPRRMDGFARPTAARPVGPQPQARTQPQPSVRVAAPVRQAPQPAQPMARPVRPAPLPQQAVAGSAPARPAQPQPRPAQPQRRGGGWRVVVQFIVGLLVIVGVAAAIVALYVRYYQ